MVGTFGAGFCGGSGGGGGGEGGFLRTIGWPDGPSCITHFSGSASRREQYSGSGCPGARGSAAAANPAVAQTQTKSGIIMSGI